MATSNRFTTKNRKKSLKLLKKMNETCLFVFTVCAIFLHRPTFKMRFFLAVNSEHMFTPVKISNGPLLEVCYLSRNVKATLTPKQLTTYVETERFIQGITVLYIVLTI